MNGYRVTSNYKYDITCNAACATFRIYAVVLRSSRPKRTTTMVIPTDDIKFSIICSDLCFRLGIMGGTIRKRRKP